MQTIYLGQIASAVIRFALSVFMIRTMTKNDYGLFSLFVAAFLLISGFNHFGWLETFIRYGAEHFGKNSFKSVRSYIFKNLLVLASIVTVVALMLSGWAAREIYHREEFLPYLQLALVFSFVGTLYNFTLNNLAAQQRFKYYVSIDVGNNLARALLVVAAFFLDYFYLKALVLIYIAVPVVISIYQVLSEKIFFTSSSEDLNPEEKLQIKHYAKWLWISTFTTAIIGNVDLHFVAHYLGNEVIADFGAAARLTLPISFLVTAFQTAMLPKLSATKKLADIEFYLQKLKTFLPWVGALLLLGSWFLAPYISIIAGEKYNGILLIVRLFLVSYIITLFVNPVSLVMYSWGWTKKLAILNFVQLVLDIILNFLWIPVYGATGAILSTIVITLVGLVYVYYCVHCGLREMRAKESENV